MILLSVTHLSECVCVCVCVCAQVGVCYSVIHYLLTSVYFSRDIYMEPCMFCVCYDQIKFAFAPHMSHNQFFVYTAFVPPSTQLFFATYPLPIVQILPHRFQICFFLALFGF